MSKSSASGLLSKVVFSSASALHRVNRAIFHRVLSAETEPSSRILESFFAKNCLTVGLLYLVSFGLSLTLPNAYFWDDWINYFGKTGNQVRSSTGPFSGFSPLRLVMEGWMSEHWISGFRILTFLLFPLAAVSLHGVLRQISFFTSSEKFALVSLFLLLPVNSARHSMTILMYSSCYASFFVGWWLYSRNDRWILRALSLIFFLNSFDTASLIFFMAVPLAVSLYCDRREGSSVVVWAVRNVVFVAAPLAYWIIEPRLNPTLDAVRAEYYTPKTSGVLRGFVLLFILGSIVMYGLLVRKWRYASHRGQIQFIVGLIVMWIGIFPYMTLGHFPNLESLMISFVPGQSDWDSRHQLLLPLGLALSIVGALNYLGVMNLWRGVFPILIFCSLLNLTFTQEYYLDSIKTSAILNQLADREDLVGVRNVLIDDQALRFNARGRRIRTYEWDTMLNATKSTEQISSEVSRFIDCENFRPEALITITAARGKLMTLLTRDPKINVSVEALSLCPNRE